ncbi:MAG: PSD1 domain-containing protein [Planctomycetaceae bacterium]|nr:PSD1 domain-containing protein [Planctomycetaceae bacterium]
MFATRAWIAIIVLLCGAPLFAAPLDFQRDVRPILVEHCFHCHGLDDKSREAGLRLDLRESATAKLESGATAIVAGSAAQSELFKRITATDPSTMMPPPSVKKRLTPAEVKALEQWLNDGAAYAGHWSFETPQRPTVPAKNSQAIDAFVAARLQRAGLQPSPPAPPEVLCRRIYLDVIGLPPSPAETAAFVAAAQHDQPQAVRALVDRLLASEHFGEKWARHWLDAARYADSNGYEKDLPRDQWAWRDWVIAAFNRDLPYDEFITHQIAGDLLARADQRSPSGTVTAERQDLLVATGFLRNGMINEEGAIVPEEFRMDSMFDRIDCLGKAVLGLSLQCGQCHTHKFDPLTQTEYYGLFAFLNNTYEAQSWVYSPEQLAKIASINQGIEKLHEQIKRQLPDWSTRLAEWESQVQQRQAGVTWQVVEAEDLHSSSELNHPTMLADKSILTLGHKTIFGDVYMIAEPPLAGVAGVKLEILRHGDLPFDGPGRSFKGTWALTELIVEQQQPGEKKWEKLKLIGATADFAEPAHPLEAEWGNKSRDKDGKRTCGPVAMLVDGKDETAWRADRGPGRRNAESVAVAHFEKPLDLPPGTKLKISLRTNHGGDDNGPKNVMVGRFRVSLTQSAAAQAEPIAYAAMLAMQTPLKQRTAAQSAEIFAAWRQTVPELKPLNDQIEALWKQYPEAKTSVLHVAERSAEDTRTTFRLDRGVWTRPKEAVAPHVPAALHSLASHQSAPPTRLDFARWLADRRSPLTARVAVNRVWQAMFGVGLVETAEDFGTRAPIPDYPELLDWLSVEFMDQAWSHKQLIRTIITSATYQQSSVVTPALLERDPRNRLLARGPRFRVEAEVVRDMALGLSGLLTPKVGGPSIFPPVPQSMLDYNYFKPTYWIAAEGPERYRRALYVFRKRSMPDPVLTTFDAPNADFACARRPRSNTPLAALVSLNEPVFVESARALALRVLKEGGADDPARIAYAFRLCTGRAIKPAERDASLTLLAEQRKRVADGWLSVREITTGDATKLPPLPDGCTPQDAAAWTLAARVLLNLDETLTKN